MASVFAGAFASDAPALVVVEAPPFPDCAADPVADRRQRFFDAGPRNSHVYPRRAGSRRLITAIWFIHTRLAAVPLQLSVRREADHTKEDTIMKRIMVIGLALMAMLVVAGGTASSASAWSLCMETDEAKTGFYSMFCSGSQISEGEFIIVESPLVPTANSQLYCAKVAAIGVQKGQYNDSKCTEKKANGAYATVVPLGQRPIIVAKEPDPVAFTVANDKFTMKSGAMILRNKKVVIKCEKGEGTGETTEREVEGKQSIDGIKIPKITYKGCTAEREATKCEISGKEFSTKELSGELVELDENSETGVGELMKPASGSEFAKIEMTCGGEKPSVTVTGTVIGQIPGESFEQTSKESKVVFSQSEGNQEFKKVCELNSKESDSCVASKEYFLSANEEKAGFESTEEFEFTTEQETL
jgi:hypothetical protein